MVRGGGGIACFKGQNDRSKHGNGEVSCSLNNILLFHVYVPSLSFIYFICEIMLFPLCATADGSILQLP